ncbi:sulfhydryl oxidase 1 [Brachyhypopomus gauderio]|uniref:sulfhydryl oxidase 1 n=1 Tax=Brachyhypopomus gauderio TaxID=698409 RepID=UPI0040426D4B
MAHSCRATSPCARLKHLRNLLFSFLCSCVCRFPVPSEAVLYTGSDQISIITPHNVDWVVFNSTSAVVMEFYATWCGHCVAFSPAWKELARDVREWKPAVELAAIDCSEVENTGVCRRFGITGYPSLKFFHAYSDSQSNGKDLRGFPRDVPSLRHLIIDQLEQHREHWPPHSPPLEPASVAEVDAHSKNSNVHHLALVFETDSSYVGREVTLDLLQYENIAVRRVLHSERELVTRLNVTQYPSCYLYNSPTNYTRLTVLSEARYFYSHALQRLPGVVRAGKPHLATTELVQNGTELWRPFDRTRVYMSDLESVLQYSLRVELAAHNTISGDALTALRQYVSILAKYFPGRPVVQRSLQSVDTWLQGQKEATVTYREFRAALDGTVLKNDSVLPEAVRWVGCQGSMTWFRGYPCAMWTLFHVLTVQAKDTGSTDPQEVLQAMRRYIGSFFGCRDCATHFERMAEESLKYVNTPSTAVLWLWSHHNRVNNRLAGAQSEDPHFPKIQWPSPELCHSCHGLTLGGEHAWRKEEVLLYLQDYYSAQRILPDYLQEESEVVAQQRATLTADLQLTQRRKARDAPEATPNPASLEDKDDEEEEEETETEGVGQAGQDEEPHPAGQQEPSEQAAWRRDWPPHKPIIMGLKLRQAQEDIVDLDSFVSQHFRAKTVQAGHTQPPDLRRQESAGRLQGRVKRELIGLGEADGGGLVLEPFPRAQGPRWMSVFSTGFSRLDMSLCVLLYLLSCLCLLTMWLYVRARRCMPRAKVSLP